MPEHKKNHLAVSEEENSKKSLLERKAEFIRAVLDDMDEETFTALESEYYLTYSKGEEFPCQFTVEELKQQIRQSEKEIDNGDYIAHEDLEKYILG